MKLITLVLTFCFDTCLPSYLVVGFDYTPPSDLNTLVSLSQFHFLNPLGLVHLNSAFILYLTHILSLRVWLSVGLKKKLLCRSEPADLQGH